MAIVEEALPSATFKCKLRDNNHIVLAHLSGSMRENLIKVIPGDIGHWQIYCNTLELVQWIRRR